MMLTTATIIIMMMINNFKKKKKKNCTFSGTEVIKYSRNRKATKKEPE